ncbi:MAG: hypothetical protein ACFFCS_18850 [Candidatus Hodarchaeota archaeon]
MTFNENFLSKRQDIIASSAIKSLVAGFDLENPPEHVIKGLDPEEVIAEIEASKEGKTGKELKKLNKKIKDTNEYVDNYVKIVFHFEEGIRTLVLTSDVKNTRKFYVPRRTWTGVLDFPISTPFIFGRACKKARHGGGTYCFAPFHPGALKVVMDVFSQKFEKVFEKYFPFEIVEGGKIIEFLEIIRFTPESIDQMRTMFQLMQSKEQSGIPLIDTLNSDVDLVKAIKKIPHFGNSEWLKTLYQSEVDVSTVFFPYKETTIFQIDNFVYTTKDSCKALKLLVNTLKSMQ